MRLHTAFLTSLLRRHILGMGLTASALSTAPAAKGAIRYRQLWVSADGVTHIDEQECGKLETKDFTATGGDAALQYVRAFSDSDDFALTGLVVTQQVGENPWHFCPSPQSVAVWKSKFCGVFVLNRRDTCSMAWRCRFLTARRSQHGRVIAATHWLISTQVRRDARRQLVHSDERRQDHNI
jgi:hypothetical protein